MKTRKKIALVLAVVSIITLAVGSLAFLSDRIDAAMQATAGTLDLRLTSITASKTDNFKPGEGIGINFTLSNGGSKSADILETLVLESSVAMSDTTEFELYAASDVTVDDKGVVTAIKDGALPLQVRSVNAAGTQITYKIPEFILNGIGKGAEEEDGALGTSKDHAYVLVFRNHADNDFQNASIKIYYEAQAKQHRNTNADTWAVIQNVDITFAGSSIKSVAENSK